jgi:hypothetical protein
MTIVHSPCPVGLALRVYRQDDPRDLAPVSAVRIGIEHAQIGDQMLFVVRRERWIGGREVGDIGIEGRRYVDVIAVTGRPPPDIGGQIKVQRVACLNTPCAGRRLPVQWNPCGEGL